MGVAIVHLGMVFQGNWEKIWLENNLDSPTFDELWNISRTVSFFQTRVRWLPSYST